MSRQSEAVKRWRRSIKDRAVKSFGGKCELCGYHRCNNALEFHHTDPSEKEFNFGRITANPKNMLEIQAELKKCVMVCSNCHKEIHAGLAHIPKSVLRNRPEVSMDSLKPKQEYDACPVCGKLKPVKNITCSLKCAAKKSRKVDWDSIDLSELLKTKSMLKIADELGVSEMAVRKRRKKLGI